MQGKDTDTEDVLRTQGKGNVGRIGGAALMSIHSRAEKTASRKLLRNRELGSVHWDDLEGWEGGFGGRGYVAGLLTSFVQQKLTDHQKTIILQLKEFKKKKKRLACKLIRVGSGVCSASSCLAAALPRRLVDVP